MDIKCINDLQEAKTELRRITNRTSGDSQNQAEEAVKKILLQVLKDGDEALIKLTEKFDGVRPERLFVTNEELKSAWEQTPQDLQEALQVAHRRIREFHEYQKPQDISFKGIHGEHLGRR